MRNVARIKLGYYPLPPEEGKQLRKLLDFSAGIVSAVDPCAGTGAALHQLTEGAQVESTALNSIRTALLQPPLAASRRFKAISSTLSPGWSAFRFSDAEFGRAYAAIEHDIREAVKKNRGNRSLMSLMMHRLLLYPEHPFGIGEIWGKRFNPTIGGNEHFLVTTAPDLREDFVYAKERKLIEDIREELRQGRCCQDYATFRGEHDVAARLERVLRQAGLRVAVLGPTVPTLKRELWYEKQLKDGVEVVVCHPKLVETGLDFVAFPQHSTSTRPDIRSTRCDRHRAGRGVSGRSIQ